MFVLSVIIGPGYVHCVQWPIVLVLLSFYCIVDSWTGDWAVCLFFLFSTLTVSLFRLLGHFLHIVVGMD